MIHSITMQVLHTNLTKPTKHFLGGKTKRQFARPRNRTKYYYDDFGNLDTRSTTVGAGNTETFTFDNLQRLTSSYRSAGGSVTFSYDSAGSFLSKSDYASLYIYNPNRPHVLNQVNLVGGGSVSFTHDQNGNVTQGDGETITYNAFNKPLTITDGGNDSTFTYGANLMRYKQETPSGSTILYIDKLMEIETLGGSVDYKHYLGDVAILTKTGSLNDPSPSVKYLFRDRLGSVSMIGDAYAAVIEHRGYDAYGKPRNGNWTNKTPATIGSSVTDRGFTDHEHLDDWQLIHMNGRGYDYNLGRFLSVDPFIQDPGNSQSINGYSYIGNNPLSGTDPTGYAPEKEVKDSETTVRVVKEARTGSLIKRVVSATATNKTTYADGTSIETTVSVTGNGAEVSVTGSNSDGTSAGGFTSSITPDTISVQQMNTNDSSKAKDKNRQLLGEFQPGGNVSASPMLDVAAALAAQEFVFTKNEHARELVLNEDGIIMFEAIREGKSPYRSSIRDLDGLVAGIHTHTRTKDRKERRQNELPGPGDHLVVDILSVPNYYLTPTGQMRVVERIDGNHRVRTVRGEDAPGQANWKPGTCVDQECTY